MLDSQFFEELAQKLTRAVPSGVKDFGQEMEHNFRCVLQNAFAKLDLVTREEFDAQVGVLARTRERLEQLEKIVAAYEAGEQPGPPE